MGTTAIARWSTPGSPSSSFRRSARSRWTATGWSSRSTARSSTTPRCATSSRALGHSFRSNSDTEVLLAGWRQWGAAAAAAPGRHVRLRDLGRRRTRTLFAARDRFGEKPLLYCGSARQRLAFGSDLIACEAMLGETRPVDPAALRALFTLAICAGALVDRARRSQASGRTLAEVRCARASRSSAGTTWRSAAPAGLQCATARPSGPARAVRRCGAARLVSDVPVGVFLSSGIDSALVAASVAASGARLKTFTVGFEGAGDYYEERPQAAAVARHLGADHTEIGVERRRASARCFDRVFTGAR